MASRTCPDCGAEEIRKADKQGRTTSTNLDPISGLCVDCLVKMHTTFTSRRMPEALPFDGRAAAARNDE